MSDKSFCELTREEATALARRIVCSSNSEGEIRRRLTEAGFNGKAAAICSQSLGPMFQAMVMVWGPRGEVINA